jgi:L-threonylcarbamoyladenylate synthase
MLTKIVRIDPEFPETSKVKEAASFLKEGKIVAVPTETVYGLAVDANNKAALDNLYKVKKRPRTKLFTIQLSDFSQIKNYIEEIPVSLEIILKEFWPGALTVILNARDGKIGLRIPDHRITLSIIEEANIPLAVTSANISGDHPAFSAKDVIQKFNGLIDLIVDDMNIAAGIESTVLDCTVSPFKIIRRGLVADRLQKFLRLYG